MTFKEESEAMFEVFTKALQGKFPDNQMHFSIVVVMDKDMDETGNADIASLSSGNSGKIAGGLYRYLELTPEVNECLTSIKVLQ